MPVQMVIDESGRFLRTLAPKRKKNPPKTTPRDLGTMGISTSILIVLVWLINDVLTLPIPLEVAVAIANIFGFFLARRFRY